VITDIEYPKLVASSLLHKVMGDFTSRFPKTAYASFKQGSPQLDMPELKNYIQKYQNPESADSILKIQKELDETKIVMKQTIESVLERGEKIDDLVAKSDGLSAQSKMFYTQVRYAVGTVCACC
jgi:synaptobrevin family protein YKT6